MQAITLSYQCPRQSVAWTDLLGCDGNVDTCINSLTLHIMRKGAHRIQIPGVQCAATKSSLSNH
jgi:hypothetical protein